MGLGLREGLGDVEGALAAAGLADDVLGRQVHPDVVRFTAEAAQRYAALAVEQGDVRVGRSLDVGLEALTALFAPDGEFLALYREGEDGRAKPVAVFC
mgnify:CR=1 FL=1